MILLFVINNGHIIKLCHILSNDFVILVQKLEIIIDRPVELNSRKSFSEKCDSTLYWSREAKYTAKTVN